MPLETHQIDDPDYTTFEVMWWCSLYDLYILCKHTFIKPTYDDDVYYRQFFTLCSAASLHTCSTSLKYIVPKSRPIVSSAIGKAYKTAGWCPVHSFVTFSYGRLPTNSCHISVGGVAQPKGRPPAKINGFFQAFPKLRNSAPSFHWLSSSIFSCLSSSVPHSDISSYLDYMMF